VTDIVSISFRDDSFILTELSKNENTIDIQRAVYKKLPLFINHKSIQESETIQQIASGLTEVSKDLNLQEKSVHVTIPGRFALIKKIFLDDSIPPDTIKNLVSFEFEKLWDESRQNYHVYLTEESSDKNKNDILAVAIRKKTLEFYNSLFQEMEIDPEIISLSCFTIEELLKKAFPDSTGQSLLLGWQRRGLEAILSENEKFVSYRFQSYNKKYDPIETISEFDLANAFSSLLQELKKPKGLSEELFQIQTIYNFGYYFKPEWLDFMRSRTKIPINLFNFDTSSKYTLKISESAMNPEHVYRYIEPLSNAFN
jgi:hypothetical protein